MDIEKSLKELEDKIASDQVSLLRKKELEKEIGVLTNHLYQHRNLHDSLSSHYRNLDIKLLPIEDKLDKIYTLMSKTKSKIEELEKSLKNISLNFENEDKLRRIIQSLNFVKQHI